MFLHFIVRAIGIYIFATNSCLFVCVCLIISGRRFVVSMDCYNNINPILSGVFGPPILSGVGGGGGASPPPKDSSVKPKKMTYGDFLFKKLF